MNKEIEQILLQGLNLMQTGKTADAESVFKTVIQSHPDIKLLTLLVIFIILFNNIWTFCF
jgi:hypothetical protein